ncbi:cation transport protein-domain-containing protein [Xylaria arbuscula]|nr:cation transport protein-domain-containing protein [Xylaria arbuscula]
MGNTREHLLRWVQALRPAFISKHPHFNFITLHYFWIIGWTIIGSILIYATAGGQLAYIDALSFAAGANTQAGLNTKDINLLNTFQQLVMYFCALLSNPITIHSSVVFLRLYWFEKRFQHIVEEARSRRVTISKSRTKARLDAATLEKGINGQTIDVVRDTGRSTRVANDGVLLDEYSIDGQPKQDPLANTSGSEDGSEPIKADDERQTAHPQIKFAPDVRRSRAVDDDDGPPVFLPEKRTNAEHIAILEKQRKADKSVLRIPGPRDADMGALPEEFEEIEAEPDILRRRRESSTERQQAVQRPLPYGERQQTITIAEPDKPRKEEHHLSERVEEDAEAAAHALGASLRFRKSRTAGSGFPRHNTTSTFQDRINPIRRIKTALAGGKEMNPMPYLSWEPTIGRNSQFVDLTEDQRDELGGIEYRSLKTLALVLTIYFWGYSILGIITLLPWIVHNNPYYGSILEADGINRVWWAFWTSNSAFMDLGFTLTPDSMNSFNTAIFPLLIMSFLVILGNTGFPVALRFMIWLGSLIVPRGSGVWEELRFLLDHPRRCFTLLFPSNANWWLFFILVALNGIDLLLFLVLDLGRGAVSQLPLNVRFLDGWFQAASTRTAGFSCINLSEVHPAVQTSYLIMMYISVFPVAISIRKTNVYEEQSLGVYESHDDFDDNQPSISYVGTHLRRQLSFDLWYVFLGFFILTITEGPRLISGDISMFAVLFELVSAYGTVGLSLGYPNTNASLVAQFSTLGKLVIVAGMIRGRHRGLPYGLDRAVLLPSENLNRKEAEDVEVRLQRRQSALSVPPGTDARPASVRRGRSKSVDRGNIVTGLLHIGPAYSVAKSEAKSELASGFSRPDTLRRYTSAASVRTRGSHDQGPTDSRARRSEPQPVSTS